MNIFQIIISKVSATVTVIMISLGLQIAPTPVVEVPVVAPVTIVTATTTNTFLPEATKTIDTPKTNTVTVSAVVLPQQEEVIATTTATTTVQDTVQNVVQATTSPVVVPVVTLPTTNQVAPTVAPQTVIIQIQQPEVLPVASAPIQMGTLYKLTKGTDEEVILDNVSEGEIRNFAEGLNSQINWRKQVRTISMEKLTDALKANDYNLTEK